MATNDARNPVRSVQTTIDILHILKKRGAAGVTELADETGISKGSAHCHLSTLRQNGYVVKDGEKYKLGLQFVNVAHHVLSRNEVYDIVSTEVERLAERTGELALFTVEEQNQGICLYKASGANAVQTQLYVGYRNNLYHTAVGKVILANKSPAELDEFLANTELEPLTRHTITDESRLREELAEIAGSGIGFNRKETMAGLAGVAAPVHAQSGGIYGGIGVIGPASRMSGDHLDEVIQMLNSAVDVVEVNATAL